MLKIVHLITGAAALLLSFIPSLQSEALPYLQHPDALYQAFFWPAEPDPGPSHSILEELWG